MKLEIVSEKSARTTKKQIERNLAGKICSQHPLKWKTEKSPFNSENCNPLFFSFCLIGKVNASSHLTAARVKFRFHMNSYWFEINTPQLTTLLFRTLSILVTLFYYIFECFVTHNGAKPTSCKHTHRQTRANLNDAFTNFYWFCHERRKNSKQRKRSDINRRNVCVCHHCCRVIIVRGMHRKLHRNKYQIQNARDTFWYTMVKFFVVSLRL